MKHPVPDSGYLCINCWLMRPHNHPPPNNTGLLQLLLVAYQNLIAKTYSWTYHTLFFTGLQKCNLEFSPFWLAFIMIEGTRPTSRKIKVINNLPQPWSQRMASLATCAHMFNSGMIIEVTKYFLAGFEGHSIRTKSCLVLSTWSQACDWGYHRPYGKSTAMVLLIIM